jgi:hypothetical protein
MPKKRVTDTNLPTNAKTEQFEMLFPLLVAILHEVKELSKKKQDEHLNKLKVGMINKILSQVKDVLQDDPTAQFLDLLDDVTLPTNSDAVLVIAQYKAAMEQYKEKYYGWAGSERRWFTKELPPSKY